MGEGDDGFDGFRLGNKRVVETFLVPDHHVGIHEESLHLVDGLNDLPGRAASPAVVEILGQIGSVGFQGHLPSLVMEAHRVGKGPVAIKDVRVELPFWNQQFGHRST